MAVGWKSGEMDAVARPGLSSSHNILYQLGGCCWGLGGSSTEWVCGLRCEGGARAQGWKTPDAKCVNFSCDPEASLVTPRGCPGPAERGKA